MDLEYTAKFKESDVINDISSQIEQFFTDLSKEEVKKLAEESVEYLKNQGLSALYQGFIKEGVKYALFKK